ncbi:hypothetical protein ACIQB4_28200 [Streptomyces griseoluteus]|uniref:hypothetical protein n=1 Tax=Streptomyces griseoluteus TaxID=29306 RepID=UPI0038135B2A
MLFAHGTCVVLEDRTGESVEQAVGILRQFGHMHVATSASEFHVLELDSSDGWLVTSYHSNVMTFVPRDDPEDPSRLAVGILGRSRRDRDDTELRVVQIEAAPLS